MIVMPIADTNCACAQKIKYFWKSTLPSKNVMLFCPDWDVRICPVILSPTKDGVPPRHFIALNYKEGMILEV